MIPGTALSQCSHGPPRSQAALLRRVMYVVRRRPGRCALSTETSSLAENSDSPSSPASLTVGVLRETYDKWERRAPLTPDQCRDFLQRYPQSKIVVQPSSHRIFSNTQYEHAGVTVKEDLEGAQLILGVKRPQSMDHLPCNDHKTYMFFSHVVKGQPENMVRIGPCVFVCVYVYT
jgi:hypothetical protein